MNPCKEDYVDREPAYIVSLEELDVAGNYRVKFDGVVIVTRTTQPTLAAAQWFHELGAPDDVVLISVYAGQSYTVGQGAIGVLRRLTVREDIKAGPRFVMREPWPSSDEARRRREYEIRAGAEYYYLSLRLEKSGATLLERPFANKSKLGSKRPNSERKSRPLERKR